MGELKIVMAWAIVLLLGSALGNAASSDEGGEHPGIAYFVPRTVLYPGDELTTEMLQVKIYPQRVRSSATTGFLSKIEDGVGRIVRRTLLRGKPIPMSALRRKALVKQGQTYTMVFRSTFLAVMGSGVPLQSAAQGEEINVRNPETGVVVRARVAADRTLVVERP